MLLYAIASYQYLADELLSHHNFEQGLIERKIFPDGELYHRIIDDVADKEVALIAGTPTDYDLVELYDLATALVMGGCRRLQIIIPYFGYSTMERSVKSGEIVKAKNRANILSALPHGNKPIEFTLLDLHAEGIPYYFQLPIAPHHLYCKQVVLEAATSLGGKNFVLASTDSGRAKWIESLAKDMEIEAAFVYKRRLSGKETQVTGINADVSGKTVVIYDDMIRTGGSLLKAAKAYQEYGAKDIFAVCTHAILPDNSLDILQSSGLIKKIIATNTHPRSIILKNSFLEIRSVASIIKAHLLKGQSR
ncbi:MAG: ribose-phosphate diphosphokinase [Bacteroidia bacterium]|nr:ribose-phosphate diphosphokinase [Bacteroidia bacterium]